MKTLLLNAGRHLAALLQVVGFTLGQFVHQRLAERRERRPVLHWNGDGVYRIAQDYEPPDLAQFDPETVGRVGSIPLTDGWSVTGGEGTVVEVDGGRLRVEAAAPEAEVGREVDIPAASVSAIVLTMRVTAGNQAQMYWRVREHPDRLAGMQEVWLRPHWGTQQYRIPVGDDPAWRGRVCELRICPSNAPEGAVAVIEEIALECEPLERQLAASYQSVRQVKIAGEMRRVLFAPTPTVIERHLQIPDNAVLQLGFGVMQRSWWSEAGSVQFRVSLKGPRRAVALLEESVRLQQEPEHWRWYDHQIDLSPFAGRRMTLRLETGRGGEGGPALAVWSDPCLFSRAKRADPRPNVILISVDALRADRLGCYGYALPTSPEIDRLAAQGVRFSRAISQSTWTLPSHLSLLTSRYPLEYGDTSPNLRPRPDFPHLSELLSEAGYATGAITGGAYVGTAFGFARGFDHFLEQDNIERCTRAACEWLETNASRPFFLFLHTYEVHNYFLQLEHYLPLFRTEPYHGRVRPGFDFPAAMTQLAGTEDRLTDADMAHVKALYDGEVCCADVAVGRIFARLRELGLMERTLVILLSDHGEELGEHGLFAHQGPMHDEVVHVPLIVSPPAGATTAGGRVVDRVVELTDVAPTILEAAGLTAPEQMVGQSLWPAIRGERSAARDEQGGSVRRALSSSHGTRWAITTEDWRYESLARPSLRERDERLHDLRSDPAEQENVLDQHPEVAAEFRRYLWDLVARRGRGYRLFLKGKETTAVRLRSSSRFRYLQIPALSLKNAVAFLENKRRLDLQVGPSEAALVVLGLEEGATLRVTADSGGQLLEASRICLGATGAHPPGVPLTVGSDLPFAALEAEQPPRYEDLPDTAIWIWRPTAEAAAQEPVAEVDSETRRQLRALGYVD